VRILEDVEDRELPAIYRHAAVFVYPTFAEGFGMPVLEAMAAGVPVIASNKPAIREITGVVGAEFVDPSNVEEITLALHRVLNDRVLAARLRSAGVEKARSFTWGNAAKTVRDHYLKIFESGDLT
jgi:glycosyltransferase involved in cell wall biosynthesis